MNKKLLIGLGMPIVASIPFISVVSCSNSNLNANYNVKTFKTQVQRIKKETSSNIDLPTNVNIYDANYNPDALQQLEEIRQKITVTQLDYDFSRVLQDFYESYEKETPLYEIEIEKIKVVSKNEDGSFQLRVTYQIEIENKRDNDEEELITKEIRWKPNFVLISKPEIEEIRKKLAGLPNNDTETGVDLEDIKEIFLGEKDEDDIDDIGIFDKIAKLNKEYDDLVYLLAYEVSISDIYDQLGLPTKNLKTIDKNTKFHVPSLSLNASSTIFLPDRKPKFDMTPKSLTKSEIENIFNDAGNVNDGSGAIIIQRNDGDQTNKVFVDFLEKILQNTTDLEQKLDQAKAKISFIALIKPSTENENQYQVIIEYDTKGLEADMIVLVPSDNNQTNQPTL